MSMRRAGRSKRLLLVMGIAGLTLFPAGPAVAHVHGITPLRCVGVDDDGANATDETPAALANGGPIAGLIPSTVGASDLGIGDGGFDTPACPAP
jgi:hypothetical protein